MTERKANLCRGRECPNRGQCKRYLMHAANPDVPSVSKCIDGKGFERAYLDHPQMRGTYPRGC